MTTTTEFVDVAIPPELAAHHAQCGGRGLRRQVRQVADGLLRVMSGYEPIGDPAEKVRRLLHVSVSIGGEEGAPTRRATDAECASVLALWPDVKFEEFNGGSTKLVRNFWEE